MNDDIISLLGWHGPDVFHLTMTPAGRGFVTHPSLRAEVVLYEITGAVDTADVAQLARMTPRDPVNSPTCSLYFNASPYMRVTVLRASWMKVSNDEAIVRFVMCAARPVRIRIGEEDVAVMEVRSGYAGTAAFRLKGWRFNQMKEVEEV